MGTDERLTAADDAYQRAVFAGDAGGLGAAERGLDALDADAALTRGRLLHARYLARRDTDPGEDPRELPLFERALAGYQASGDTRGEAEALFWIGCVHQVVRGDGATAVPLFERGTELAEAAGDRLTLSYLLRHLGIAAHQEGNLTEARELLERSTRLRRELHFDAGVAANLVGLAYLAHAEGRRADATALLDEGDRLCAAAGAHGIAAHLAQARTNLG
jgi:tetratricopeptide (TPR) repeat protein